MAGWDTNGRIGCCNLASSDSLQLQPPKGFNFASSRRRQSSKVPLESFNSASSIEKTAIFKGPSRELNSAILVVIGNATQPDPTGTASAHTKELGQSWHRISGGFRGWGGGAVTHHREKKFVLFANIKTTLIVTYHTDTKPILHGAPPQEIRGFSTCISVFFVNIKTTL